MCVAIPMQLARRSETDGEVERDGVRQRVSLMLLPEAEAGDWVLVHAGYAIARVDEAEAAETLRWLRELAEVPDPLDDGAP